MRAMVLVCGVVFATAPAWADDCADANDGEAPVVQVVNGRRMYVFRTRRICGERQTPYSFAVSGRRPLDYTAVPLRHDDTWRVVEAVRRAPF